MRVLIVGQAYIVELNRFKLYELVKMKQVELFLVIPEIWFDPLFKIPYKARVNNIPFSVFPLKTFFSGIEGRCIYSGLVDVIKKVEPDIIQVEQGANALAYFQAIVLKKLFCPRAKMLFFTWMNVPYKNGPFFSRVEKFNLKNSDGAICGNEGAKQILREKGFMKPVTVIPQFGVDAEIFSKKNVDELKQKLGLKTFTIGYAGRLKKEKGILTLIEALGGLKDKNWQLLVLGRGPLKGEMEKKSELFGIKNRIIFIDSVPHGDVPNYMNCMDLLVLPSLREQYEQFGHVLIEAMACEVPVIGSTSGEIPNVIGDAGLVFEQGNVNDLKEKILLLMENEGLRKELAQKGRQRVLEKYTNKKIAGELYKFYQQIL